MIRFLRLSILLFSLINSIWCSAETGHLYTADKLSSGLITCVCQDRYGYIWIGTEYGLNKFDGYRYTSYFHSRTDTTTINGNEISSLFIDHQGQLWVGCSKGLVRYDYERDLFHRYTFPDNRTPRINALTEHRDGRLLIGTAGYGLYSQHNDTPIHYEGSYNRRNIDRFYYCMHIDREGRLWRSSHVATFTRFVEQGSRQVATRDYESSCGQPVKFLEYSKRLLIVCMNGILAFDYQTESIGDAGFDLSALADNVSIQDATIDREGNIYLATSGSGLMKISKGRQQLTAMVSDNADMDLNTANVVDVMEDKDQNLWAACYSKGLMVMSKQQSPFYINSLSQQHYLTGSGVSSITPDGSGGTWCTVQNSGVYHFDSMGRVTSHPQSPKGTRLICRSKTGRYWLTAENVLYRYDPSTGNASPELTLEGRGLNCLAEDADGRLYISTFGSGLYAYDPDARQGVLLSMQQTGRKGGYLCNDWIKALMFDSHGVLWICTTNGLSMMLTDGYVFNSLGWNTLLEGKQCYTTCETAGGDILIGTESGLYRYDRKKNKTSEVAGTEPLHDKMICAMAADKNGDIWISTTMGIWQYNEKQGRLTGHIAGNALITDEYVLGAIIHHSDDRISFGIADGLVTFHPHQVSSNRQLLGPTFLTRITASGKTLNPLQHQFELPYSDNSFTLEFSLLDYHNAENIVFLYRLNHQGRWMQTNEGNNQLVFNQLQPGRYTIEIKAKAGSAISETTNTITITIQKPWYKTPWAYALYFLIVAAFGAMFAFSWRRYLAEKRLHLIISDLKQNMKWLRGKVFGSSEEGGEIKAVRVKDNNDALMERVLKSVNENLSNTDFGVESLTKSVGISRAQLHRKMKEMTGLSTSEFIRNVRLEQAARLIGNKKINITQVAYSVGFNNQAHFSTVFKKHFGMTPTEYAEMKQNETTMKHAKTGI